MFNIRIELPGPSKITVDDVQREADSNVNLEYMPAVMWVLCQG